jgi:NAD(P)-dependent dehydrogenase (short-subunit alcohol dehydrogenase family)
MPRPERPVALVTGASRGIGRAIAIVLAPDHDLVLVARDASNLEATRNACAAAGGSAITCVAGDLASASGRAALATYTGELDPPVSVLVNNAGVAPSVPLAKTSNEVWASTMAVNATAPFELTRAVLPGMLKLGWGRVVNIVSTAALKGYRYTAAYSASKGALLALTRAVAAEVSRKGITVNALCPGFTDTDIVADAVANISNATGRDADQARASLESFSPQGRLVTPDEVAAAVAYLVSEPAAAVHGQAIPIDGGETTL